MKYLTLYLLILMTSLMAPAHASAQVPVAPEAPLVNQYLADAYAERSAAWWNALGRQLTLSVDVPYDRVDGQALQNIIFFATHFGEQVKLSDATPRLLDVYRHHDDAAFRVMALAALHAIGDEDTMQRLNRLVRSEEPGRVRRLTVAALNDHYHQR